MRLIEPLLRALRAKGYTTPTAIQEQTFSHVVEGKDLLGCAQTGTGKTAAFALPILQRLHAADTKPAAAPDEQRHVTRSGARKPIRTLVLSPTRELAAQIADSFEAYGKHTGLRHTVVYGGVRQGPQCQALRQGVDILVATPGRLLDLLNQNMLSLREVEILVLDEADRMLDMGFINDIRKIISKIPAKRQTLMFSATMPAEIRRLADDILHNPVTVKVAAQSAAADTVEQSVYMVDHLCKADQLEDLLKNPEMDRVLIFTRTKRGADRVSRRLTKANSRAEAIHSDKSQSARLKALANFKAGTTRVLVASDLAARGLDVDQISHVINYDMPHEAETYVHRIGRTGRAGLQGQAISFCTGEDHGYLKGIERLIGRALPVIRHEFKASAEMIEQAAARRLEAQQNGRGGRSRNGAGGGGGNRGGNGHSNGDGASQQRTFWRGKSQGRRTAGAGAGRTRSR